MKELVEVIAKALVEHPDEVAVRERTEGKVIKVDLYVAPADMGKVIGRQGRIAKAIRARSSTPETAPAAAWKWKAAAPLICTAAPSPATRRTPTAAACV